MPWHLSAAVEPTCGTGFAPKPVPARALCRVLHPASAQLPGQATMVDRRHSRASASAPEQQLQSQRGARWMLLAAVSLVLVLAQLMLAAPARRTAHPSRCSHETMAAPTAAPAQQSSMFYLVTLREAEEQAPWLAGCGVTVFAALAYQHMESSPRRTLDPGRAVLWVWPPYAAWETNWCEKRGSQRASNAPHCCLHHPFPSPIHLAPPALPRLPRPAGQSMAPASVAATSPGRARSAQPTRSGCLSRPWLHASAC